MNKLRKPIIHFSRFVRTVYSLTIKFFSREVYFLLRQSSITTSFPEVVMYVRSRWQQFIKYMVLRTNTTFLNRLSSAASSTMSSVVVADSHRPDRAARRHADGTQTAKSPSATQERRIWALKWHLVQKWCAHAVWTQDTESVHGPRTLLDVADLSLMRDQQFGRDHRICEFGNYLIGLIATNQRDILSGCLPLMDICANVFL